MFRIQIVPGWEPLSNRLEKVAAEGRLNMGAQIYLEDTFGLQVYEGIQVYTLEGVISEGSL